MAKKYSYWLQSGKYSLLQKLTIVFAGLVTFMLLARLFETPEKFGIWGLFLIVTAIAETLRGALVKNGYIVFINKSSEEDKPKVEYAALLLNCIYSVVLIAFFFAAGAMLENVFHAPGFASMLRYYCLILILLIPFSHREYFLSARVDFRKIFYMYSGRNGVFMAIVVFLFLTKTDVSLETLTLLYGFSILTGTLAGLLPVPKQKLKLQKDSEMLRRFVRYCRFTLGTNFFSLIFRNTDSFMITRFISPTALAFYNASTRITNFAEMPSQVLGDVMFPRAAFVSGTGDKEGIRNLYEKTVAATLTVILPAVLFVSLFTREVVILLVGRNYLDAVPVLQIMIFYTIFQPFIQQFGNIMDATGRPRVNFLVMMIFCFLNIGINYFFIMELGLTGAAWGTLITYFILFCTTQILLTRLAGISQLNIVKNIFVLYPDYLRLIRSSFQKIFRPGLIK